MTISKDQEIKQLRTQIKKNRGAIIGLSMQRRKALSNANKYAKQIEDMQTENAELMKRLNDLGNQKLKDRMEIIPAGGIK